MNERIKNLSTNRWLDVRVEYRIKWKQQFYRIEWLFDSAGRPTEIIVDDCYESFDKFSVDNRDGKYAVCTLSAQMLARECFNSRKGTQLKLASPPVPAPTEGEKP